MQVVSLGFYIYCVCVFAGIITYIIYIDKAFLYSRLLYRRVEGEQLRSGSDLNLFRFCFISYT